MIDIHNEQIFNNNNNKFANDDNLYITITNSNSMNDKTILLEKLLTKLDKKMTINIFTETCLQKNLPENYLGRKWYHALTTSDDKNGGVSICYHPAFGWKCCTYCSPAFHFQPVSCYQILPSSTISVCGSCYLHTCFYE